MFDKRAKLLGYVTVAATNLHNTHSVVQIAKNELQFMISLNGV